MILDVPTFARISDYLGLWSIEPAAAALLFEYSARLDLAAHVREPAEPLRAAAQMVEGPGDRKIAVIPIAGVMMKSQSSLGGTSTVQIRRDVRQAAADPQVAGILLNVDSPGGTVAGTDQLARDIKAAGAQKPVWSHIEDLGASAGYWAASQADRITAESNNTQAGSIGTYHVLRDASLAAEREGVRTLVLNTGPLKGMGAYGTKITDEQAAHVQGLVDAAQETFDQAVQSGRRLSKAELADVRSGGVFPARVAKQKKLIDGVQSLGKTLDQFRAALKSGTTTGYRQALALLVAGECEVDPGTGELVSCDRKAAGDPKPPTDKPTAAGALPTRPRGLPMLG